jgi:predicted N-acetyltransferase YhbS
MSRSSASNKSREVPGIKLRKLTARDIPQIIAIHGAITKKKTYRRSVQQTVKDHLRKREAVGFVAEKERQVIGFIIGEMKGEGFGLEKSGWLEVVMVHPRYMGTGTGHALARKLFQKKGNPRCPYDRAMGCGRYALLFQVPRV